MVSNCRLGHCYFSNILCKRKGINVHVFVDETRPRNQGAQLTTWELLHNNISHDLIVDNAGGHLMQHNEIDLVIVGSIEHLLMEMYAIK